MEMLEIKRERLLLCCQYGFSKFHRILGCIFLCLISFGLAFLCAHVHTGKHLDTRTCADTRILILARPIVHTRMNTHSQALACTYTSMPCHSHTLAFSHIHTRIYSLTRTYTYSFVHTRKIAHTLAQ